MNITFRFAKFYQIYITPGFNSSLITNIYLIIIGGAYVTVYSRKNSNIRSRFREYRIPANETNDKYTTEQGLYYDDIRLTSTTNLTCIIEASTDGTGQPTYSKYILTRGTLKQIEVIGDADNVPLVRINSAGGVNMYMKGITTQIYSVNTLITRL